jgi:hypothetical protein
MDVLDRNEVKLEAYGAMPASLVTGEGDEKSRLYFNKARRTKAYDLAKPPIDWDAFLAQATDVFVRKNTDYESAYMKGLLATSDPSFLWSWEVKKKLDRIRTWIERGELLVKGEGVQDAVVDLFVYTVQYTIYLDCKEVPAWKKGVPTDPLQCLSERNFYTVAARKSPRNWIRFLVDRELIGGPEIALQNTILRYMGELE